MEHTRVTRSSDKRAREEPTEVTETTLLASSSDEADFAILDAATAAPAVSVHRETSEDTFLVLPKKKKKKKKNKKVVQEVVQEEEEVESLNNSSEDEEDAGPQASGHATVSPLPCHDGTQAHGVLETNFSDEELSTMNNWTKSDLVWFFADDDNQQQYSLSTAEEFGDGFAVRTNGTYCYLDVEGNMLTQSIVRSDPVEVLFPTISVQDGICLVIPELQKSSPTLLPYHPLQTASPPKGVARRDEMGFKPAYKKNHQTHVLFPPLCVSLTSLRSEVTGTIVHTDDLDSNTDTVYSSFFPPSSSPVPVGWYKGKVFKFTYIRYLAHMLHTGEAIDLWGQCSNEAQIALIKKLLKFAYPEEPRYHNFV